MKKWFFFLFACAYILDYVLGLNVEVSVNKCSIIGAAIGALGALGSSLLSNSASASMNKDTRNWQHDESVYARDWQEEMYTKYQSPKALIQQQLEAGVNPFISEVGSGGTFPSSNAPQAPQPPNLHYDNFLGQGVQTYLQASQVQAQNQSYLAQTQSEIVKTGIYLGKEYGEKAMNEYLDMMLPQLDFQGQANVTKQVNMMFQQQQLDIQRKAIENVIRQEYGAQEAERALSLVDNQIVEIVARIGKMASDAKVNDAYIEKMGYECGKLLAESKYFKALSSQINTLLPYISSQYLFTVASMGLNFQNQYADFVGDTGKRNYIMSDDGQSRREWNYKQSPDGNYVNSFLGGVSRALNLNTSVGFHGSWHSGSSYNTQTIFNKDPQTFIENY